LYTQQKTEQLTDIINNYQFSYFGIQELNLHDRILPPSQEWKHQHFNLLHSAAATNQQNPSKRKVLHGGTAHFLDAHVTIRQFDNGQDNTLLGRWIWTLLRGRNGIQVRVICGYRPVIDTSNRPHTVYSQHEYYFNTVASPPQPRNPRQAFYEDLNHSITQWLADGDLLIVGLDANEDIDTGDTAHWMQTWGLTNALRRTHPQRPRVATCNKNRNNIPIDGIWISPGLQISAAGMTGFGELHPDPDHRILWIDVTTSSLFGFQAPPPDKRPLHSIPLHNPTAIKKYIRQRTILTPPYL